MLELPVLQDVPPERADAARNREKVLAAAEKLFAERGAASVSMDAVAAEAGVGKGTLFRRFGDRAGLAQALFSEHDRRLQERIIRGEPPLGPGAPPVERLIAFGEGMVELHERFGDVMLAAADRGAEFRSAPFALYRTHVGLLVREADPGLDADYVADALLASLRADVLAYMRRARRMPPERIAAGWAELVRRLLNAS
jgi:AcrR family transcriptional regulator